MGAADNARQLNAIGRFMRTVDPHMPDPVSLRALGGGSSNFTYLLETTVGSFVLRHGPPGHGLPGAHDMHREYRVLAALRETAVPVPAVIAYCDDSSLMGAPFYLMEHIDGVILADKPPVQPIPTGFAAAPQERVDIGNGLIATLADLHAVDPAAVGLATFGRPEGYVERQVLRWTEQWETWRTRDYPPMDEVLRRLQSAIPTATDVAIVHGDYRLGNLLLDRHAPGNIRGVLDWEMATLGDPIADLGYTLVYWGEDRDSEVRRRSMDLATITAQPGFAHRKDLVDTYAKLTGRDVSTVDYFEILARVKLAVFGERGYARLLNARAAGDVDESLLVRSEGWKRCNDHVEVALEIADNSEDRRLRAK